MKRTHRFINALYILLGMIYSTMLTSCLTGEDFKFEDATTETPVNLNVPLVYGDVMIEKLISASSLEDLEESLGKYKIRYKYNLNQGNDLATELNVFSSAVQVDKTISETPPSSGVFLIKKTVNQSLGNTGGHKIKRFQFANGKLNIEITNNTGGDVTINKFIVTMGLSPAIDFGGLERQRIANTETFSESYLLKDKELTITDTTNNILDINYDNTEFDVTTANGGAISIRVYISQVDGYKKVEGAFNKIVMRLPEDQKSQKVDGKLYPDFGKFDSKINKMKAELIVTSSYTFPINVKITTLQGIKSTDALFSVIHQNNRDNDLVVNLPTATSSEPIVTKTQSLDEKKTTELTGYKPESLFLEQETTIFDSPTATNATITSDQNISAFIDFSVIDLDLSREFEHSKSIPNIDNTKLEKAELVIKGTNQYNAAASFELQPIDKDKKPLGTPIILKKKDSEFLLEGSKNGEVVNLDTTYSINNEQVENILKSKTIKLIIHLKSVNGESFAFETGQKMDIRVLMKLNGKVTLKL